MVNRTVKPVAFSSKEKEEEEERKDEEKGENIKRNSLRTWKFGDVLGLGTGRRDMGDLKWGCEMAFNENDIEWNLTVT